MATENLEEITARNSTTSPLLRLPAELRSQIYSYTVHDGRYLFGTRSIRYAPRSSTGPSLSVFGPRPTWVGLLRTCRQINEESNALPYTLNIFRMDVQKHWNWFVEQLAKLRNPVTSLRLEIHWFPGGLSKVEGGPFLSLPHLQKIEVLLPAIFDVSKKLASFNEEVRLQVIDALDAYYLEFQSRVQGWVQSPELANMQVEFVGNGGRPLERSEYFMMKWCQAQEAELEDPYDPVQSA